MAIELRHLRYFLAVAEECHFGRAAERLHIVQPALSMQIRALEEELGGPLFLRTSRSVELTEAGVLFRVEAQRTLDQAARAKDAAQRALRGETGRVQIGFAGSAVLSGKLMGHLRAFRRAYPDVEIVTREMVPQLQAQAILAGELDVSYLPDHELEIDPTLVAEQIDEWPMVVAMPDDCPLAAKKRVTMRMLADQPLILYTAHKNDDSLLVGLRRVMGCEPKIAHRTASSLGVLALAASGLGVALTPVSSMQIKLPGLVYKALAAPGFMARLMLLSRVDEPGGAVRAFLALARKNRKT